ncbi:family 43 glycosylhydrolase [Chitinophaga ginsengisegetis]|uniref:family 43 glycosylhydrolase n=1 Tax=Chitinophaga ginsengisegetis TaxID=393003 RepID=UPI003445DFC2
MISGLILRFTSPGSLKRRPALRPRNTGKERRAIFNIVCCILLLAANAHAQTNSSLINFNPQQQQTIRFSTAGAAIDAHDGEIAYFNGTYYLYGTSYGCGFEWGKKDAPFCGFKVYTSTDLQQWTDKGFLFDARTPVWQTRCNGSTYGCFRPHVIYNKKTKQYVLWINVYDNRIGFRVFTSQHPTGPFTEVAEPTLAVNNNGAVAGLNNGDHDTFVDEDGTAYIAYTDWQTKGTIVIEKLRADYLTGSGEHAKAVTKGNTEAPALLRRNGIYYLLYSDPNCGYCAGTGTSYRRAASPLGPWSDGVKISDQSCGGQPSFVSLIKLNGDSVFLYGSDLWNKAAKNEALANYYWAPLSFAADGAIEPIICKDSIALPLRAALPPVVKVKPDNSSGQEGFRFQCDIHGCIQRSQTFTPTRSGVLTAVSITAFKSGYPDDDLHISIYPADDKGLPAAGKALYETAVSCDSLSWSPQPVTIKTHITVAAKRSYVFVIRSSTGSGCYGITYKDETPVGGAGYSADCGQVFTIEKGRVLKFSTYVGK